MKRLLSYIIGWHDVVHVQYKCLYRNMKHTKYATHGQTLSHNYYYYFLFFFCSQLTTLENALDQMDSPGQYQKKKKWTQPYTSFEIQI